MFRGSSSSSERSYGASQIVQLNDSVYELHQPAYTPGIQVVFFHGVHLGPYTNAHVSTWKSEDDSCIWPQTWLVEEIPQAHVFSVAYSGVLRNCSIDSIDMDILGEKLISDLLMANIGQWSYCPIVLVGHSIGGLVLKDLCYRAHCKLPASNGFERTKLDKFFKNLRGIFYYATGCSNVTGMIEGPLRKYFEAVCADAVRINHNFHSIRAVHNHWQVAGLGESLRAKFMGIVVAPEASTGIDDYTLVPADHFSICQPRNKFSRRFYALRNFLIHIVMKESLERKAVVTGLNRFASAVEDLLRNALVVGIVGMGGIGKTTIAKVVFNHISKSFEYTCFVDNVRGILEGELGDWLLHHFHRKGSRVEGNSMQWNHLRGRKTLIVLDGVDTMEQIRILPPLDDFGKGSRLMITSRDRGVMDVFADCAIYEVDFLNFNVAKKLFCLDAFGQEGIPDSAMKINHHLQENVEKMVQKCDGLPLTLEVLGSYLKWHVSNPLVWKETSDKLEKAQSVDGFGDDRVWSSLRVSYDTLTQQEQRMFIEAGTYFYEQPIELALAAWSTAYGYPALRWANLIRRSLATEHNKREWDSSWQKDIEYKEVWVHKHLRDLAYNLSKEAIISRSAGESERAVHRLNANEVNSNTKVLRLICAGSRVLPKLQLEMLGKLKKLKYLELDGVVHEGSSKNFPRQLSLLKWISREQSQLLPVSLQDMKNLAVLELANWVVMKEISEALGKLRNLCILSLSRIEGFHLLPENFGSLSHLKRLELRDLKLTELPNSFGNLPALKHLILADLEVRELPESFGHLPSLKTLLIRDCHMLESLPDSFGSLSWLTEFSVHNCRGLKCLDLSGLPKFDFQLDEVRGSFGNLSSLAYLGLHGCPSLESLPASFGYLSSLKELVLDKCYQLTTLPESFGDVQALRRLTVCEAYRLEALPDSFGKLAALRYLSLKRCWSLRRLPETFVNLSALEEIELEECSQLYRFPDNLGKFRALKKFSPLKKVTIERVDYTEALSDAVGNLRSLTHPSLKDFPGLERLPEYYGLLAALQKLELSKYRKLEGFPANFGQLSDRKRIIVRAPGHLDAIQWESLGKLPLAKEFSTLEEMLQSIPDSIWQLPALRKLSILASAVTENADLATLPLSEDTKIPLLLSEEAAWEDSDTMSVSTVSDTDYERRRGLVETPHCHLTDGKQREVMFWRPEMMEEFITEVNNRGESGYFVCKAWLFGLQEYEREEVMAVLRGAGYLEIYQNCSTMFYERMEDDVKVPTTCIDPACTPYSNDVCIGETKQLITSDNSGASGKIEQTKLDAENADGISHLTSQTEPGYFVFSKVHPPLPAGREYSGPGSAAALSNETCPKESSSILLDDKAETSLARSDEMLMSLKTAVKDNSLYSYCISTHWLSTLNHHQLNDLYSSFSKAGYSRIYETSTITYFECIRGHSPTNQRETPYTKKSSTVGQKRKSSELQRSAGFLASDMQGLNVSDSTTATHASTKAEEKCVCPPELLTVSFTPTAQSPERPSTSSSQGEHFSTHSRRVRGHDCYVTLPKTRKGRIMATSVDKDISLRTVEYGHVTRGWEEASIGLNVRAETTLRCCLDHNKKQVCIQLLKIGGAVEMDESTPVNTPAMVLKSVRTNLDASLNDSEDAEDVERVNLVGPPGRRVLKVGPSDKVLVWLELSGTRPRNSETGSTTIELECHPMNILAADRDESSNKALVLDFQGSPPVDFHGAIEGDLDPNSFLELNVRYESVISCIQPRCPLPPPDSPFGACHRFNNKVDFDCLLRFRTQDDYPR